jgi:hypothetical protein
MANPKIERVDRSKTRLITDYGEQSDFVDLPPEDCVAMVWELTRELWSLTGDTSAQQRLQRNVAALKKQ